MANDTNFPDMPAGKGYWFVPRMFGYGATPVTWQGWAIVGTFVAIAVGSAFAIRHEAAMIAVLTVLTVPFLAIVYAKTDGKWGWRWGR